MKTTVTVKWILFLMLVALILLVPYAIQSTKQFYDIHHWLKLLAQDDKKNPLTILRITEDNKAQYVETEVALSYVALKQHNYLQDVGKIYLIVNGHTSSTYNWSRAANGSLLMDRDIIGFSAGTNYVHVELVIFDLSNRDRMLIADGPDVEYVLGTNAPRIY